MAVYVDEAIWHWKGRRWCHLMADSEAELHRFAWQLGLHRSSYQGPPKTRAAHYDITGLERDRAIRLGAIAVGRAEIVELVRKIRVSGNRVSRIGNSRGRTAQRSTEPAAERPVSARRS